MGFPFIVALECEVIFVLETVREDAKELPSAPLCTCKTAHFPPTRGWPCRGAGLRDITHTYQTRPGVPRSSFSASAQKSGNYLDAQKSGVAGNPSLSDNIRGD